MRVGDIIRTKGQDLASVQESASLAETSRLIAHTSVGMLLVLRDQGALVGLLSDQEIIGHLATHGPAALRRGVRNAMLVSFPIATPEDSVMYIMRVMTEQRVRHLPVVAKGIVMGVISIGDVLKSQLVEKDEETAVLRDIARSRVAMAA